MFDKDSIVVVGLANNEPYLYIGTVVDNQGNIVEWASGTLLTDDTQTDKFVFEIPSAAKGEGPPLHARAANQARIRQLAKQAQK